MRSCIVRHLVLSCIFSSLSLGLAHHALAKKDEVKPVITVRYSYEKQTRDGQKRYVLVPVTERVSGDDYQDFKKRQKALFLAMKADKKANYGSTGFTVQDDTVLIFLDEDKRTNHPFIMAEAIYTFTENGARAVKFPKSKYTGEYNRRDVPYPAYRLVLPYWEGLPPRQLTSGLLSFDDGSFLTAKTLKEQVKSGDPKLVAQMVSTLKSGQIDAVKAIVTTAENASLKGLEAGLLPLLESAQEELRLAALAGLKGRTGKKIYARLRSVMDTDPSDKVKDMAASLLAKAKDPKIAVAASFHRLRSTDTSIALGAIEQLSGARGKEVEEELIKTFSRSEAEIRQAGLKALIKRKAFKGLIAQLESELSIEIKIEIAQALRVTKAGRSKAYSFLVSQPSGEAASLAISDLKDAKLKGEVSDWLKRALRHPDAEARNTAAKVLGASKSKSALAILKQGDLDDPDSGTYVLKAMREVYASLSDKEVLRAAKKESNWSLQAAATGTLGLVYQRAKRGKRDQIMAAVATGAQSSQAYIRSEAARSLGDIRTPDAMRELVKLKSDSEVVVRRQVARSSAVFTKEEMTPILLEYLKDDNASILEATLLSLGELKAISTIDQIKEERFLSHKSVEVRRAALKALISFAPEISQEELEKLPIKVNTRVRSETDPEARVLAARVLSFVPTEEARIGLSTQLQDSDVTFVKAIVDSLAAHGVPASIQLLEGGMDHTDAGVRAYTYEVAHKLDGAGLKAVAKQLFERRLKIESDEKLKEKLVKWLK